MGAGPSAVLSSPHTPTPTVMDAHTYLRNLDRTQTSRDSRFTIDDLCHFSVSARLPHEKRTVSTFHWQDDDVLQRLADMGPFLGALPIETVHEVLHQLDLATLARLQRVSQGMKRAVGSLPKLRAIIDLAPDVVPGIVATGTGAMLICDVLYDKLCDPGCDGCDGERPGQYLYLLAGHRVCYTCLVGKQRYRPLRPMQVAAQMGLSKYVISKIPGMVVPRYTNSLDHTRRLRTERFRRSVLALGRRMGIRSTTGWRLIDRETALRAAFGQWGNGRRMTDDVHNKVNRMLTYCDETSPKLKDFHPASIEASLSSVVKMPWLDGRSGRVAAEAVPCAACRAAKVSRRLQFYPLGGEQEHEEACGRIMNGVHVIESREWAGWVR